VSPLLSVGRIVERLVGDADDLFIWDLSRARLDELGHRVEVELHFVCEWGCDWHIVVVDVVVVDVVVVVVVSRSWFEIMSRSQLRIYNAPKGRCGFDPHDSRPADTGPDEAWRRVIRLYNTTRSSQIDTFIRILSHDHAHAHTTTRTPRHITTMSIQSSFKLNNGTTIPAVGLGKSLISPPPSCTKRLTIPHLLSRYVAS
jgi:hypothetical protein